MLDVLEPVRPWVDQWLWLKIHNGLLTPKDFYKGKEYGCRLNQEGRGPFFSAWYDEAESFLRAPMRDSLALLLKTVRQYRYSVE
jgi:CRISPR/Cas system-associated endonuclease Cas1